MLGWRAALANRWALGAVGFAVSLQLVALYWTPLARVLQLRPLTLREWAVVAPLALTPALIGQLIRRIHPQPPATRRRADAG